MLLKMLQTARLPPGRRALLSHPLPPTSTTTTTISARPITFAKGNTYKPFLMTGAGRGRRSSPAAPNRLVTRPPSTWSPSTISTLAAGSMLVGTWYIWEEGRNYWVAAEADKYEPRTLGTHREGKVNRDYVNYEQWVERHGRKGK